MKLLLTLLMTCTTMLLVAQNQFLDRLSVQEQNGRVAINWTISSGNTCDGTEILRSIDSLNFIRIGEIEGICGSVMQATPYRFVDENPFRNSINYYRLEFGNVGISDILSVQVLDYGDDGYVITPNPMQTEGKVFFRNDRSETHQFVLYGAKGEAVFEMATNQDFIPVNVKGLQRGIYLFTLRKAGQKEAIHGKIMVHSN